MIKINAGKVIEEMVKYFGGDKRRIHHFLKVYAFAKTIGEGERLADNELYLLETAAIVHDIGIKPAEEKFGSPAGKYQELLGPDEAEKLLLGLGFDGDFTDKVCFLVGHHHTYDGITDPVYQILVEADSLVNLYEDNSSRSAAENAYEKIFRTETGKKLMEIMFLN